MNKCCIPRCTATIPEGRLMCATHWRMVSPPTQRDIYYLYRYAPGSEEHAGAIRRAIKEVVGFTTR